MSQNTPFYADSSVALHHGDCLVVLRSLPAASVDAVVTDPPYGLGFMGREWDALPPGLPFAQECLRVLKPGGFLLAFGGTRTWHRLACAVEDAGFEIRDSIAWMYGSGFPKSLNLVNVEGGRTGWGTALKPAFEPIVVARKPIAGTVAANVDKHGTGALNIDGCRVGASEADLQAMRGRSGVSTPNRVWGAGIGHDKTWEPTQAGRWPANVVLDESQAEVLDEQSGQLQSGSNAVRSKVGSFMEHGGLGKAGDVQTTYGDLGGASRFYYVAKADASERVRVDGIAHPTVKPLDLMRWLVRLVTPVSPPTCSECGGSTKTCAASRIKCCPDCGHGRPGTVLDPFAGSGTTVEACILEGFRCIAIEREADYLPLIQQRIHRRRDPVAAVRGASEDGGLFDLLGEKA